MYAGNFSGTCGDFFLVCRCQGENDIQRAKPGVRWMPCTPSHHMLERKKESGLTVREWAQKMNCTRFVIDSTQLAKNSYGAERDALNLEILHRMHGVLDVFWPHGSSLQ